VEECKEGIPDVCTNNEKGVGVITTCLRGKLIEYSCRTAACNEKGDDCDMNMSKIECTEDDTPSVCTNDGKGIGTVKACIKGRMVEYSCRSVSCNEGGDGCGECVNNVSTCTDDEDFKGTVTKCEDGKRIEEKCGDVSCDGNSCGTCLNYERNCTTDIDGSGRVTQCVNGRLGSTMMTEQCENGYSCKRIHVGDYIDDRDGKIHWRMKLASCGECVDGDYKCVNDSLEYGTMYRCFEGQWVPIKSNIGGKYSIGFKYDDEGHMLGEPCGEYYCAEFVYASDTGRLNHWEDASYARMQVTGYMPMLKNQDGTYGGVDTKDIGLVGPLYDGYYGRARVSCDAGGKMLGVCHNSIRYCINEVRGQRGFMIVCQGGRLMDFDNTKDNIACKCHESGNNNAGCSSSHDCYAVNSSLTDSTMCEAPK
jgi:hypothetical protein